MVIEHKRGVVTLALVAAFMVFVDGTIVNLTLPQMGSHLQASPSELEWAVNAYTLSFAAVMLGAGAITDILGAKRTFVTGLVVFTAASAVCAVAGSMVALDLARLVQGVGAALLLPSALVLATAAAVDQQARHRLVGRWAAAGGLGMAAGPLLGGVLVSLAGWRSVFAVNVAIGIPALVWSLRSMPSVPRRDRRLDFPGMSAATLLIGGLVFALIEGPSQGWGSPTVLVAIGLALVGGIAFPVVERAARAPLLPLDIYADRGFTATAAQGALFNFAFYGLLFAMSLMLQQGRGLSAIASGLLFLPLTGLISVGTLCAAPLAQRWGRRRVLGVGQGALALTLLSVAWASTSASLWPLVLVLVPAGLFSGVLVSSMTAESIAVVEPSLHGVASSVFNTSRQVGSAIGVAVVGLLLGTAHSLGQGFINCLVASAGATALAMALTALVRPVEKRTLGAAPPIPSPPVPPLGHQQEHSQPSC
jgi:DHA2 family methylenomycin A resistance protein-like MFS transporter